MTKEEIPERLQEHLKVAGIPYDNRKALDGDLRETVALVCVRSWFGTTQKSIALVGRNGCGKTTAAAWAVSACMVKFNVFRWEPGDLPPDYRFKSAFYALAADLQTRTTGNTGATYHDEDKPILKRARNCSLLILDECGREDGDAQRALGPILAARMEAEDKRTILISNMLEADFRARYKGRIMSRLDGSGKVVSCGGTDLRQEQML